MLVLVFSPGHLVFSTIPRLANKGLPYLQVGFMQPEVQVKALSITFSTLQLIFNIFVHLFVGMVAAVLGEEKESGKFHVEDTCFMHLTQPAPFPTLEEDRCKPDILYYHQRPPRYVLSHQKLTVHCYLIIHQQQLCLQEFSSFLNFVLLQKYFELEV